MMGRALLPVNWLQIMENSMDPIHTEWLHGHHYEFQKEQEGVKVAISAHHEKIDFREFEFGLTKHRGEQAGTLLRCVEAIVHKTPVRVRIEAIHKSDRSQ